MYILSQMQLKLRVRKQGAQRFTSHPLDDEQYDLDGLQSRINYGIEHRSPVTIAVRNAKRKMVKFNPMEMDSITVIFDYE